MTWYAFNDTNDVTSVTETAADNSDVIYIPTDNTAASNTEAIANVVLAKKVPVIAGEEGIARGCGVAALSISYYDLGLPDRPDGLRHSGQRRRRCPPWPSDRSQCDQEVQCCQRRGTGHHHSRRLRGHC